MKMKSTAALCVLGIATMTGCSSSPFDTPPDYHTLLGAANVQKLMDAAMKCNESPTLSAAAASPWCGVVSKANRCNDYRDITPGAAEPNAACPAR